MAEPLMEDRATVPLATFTTPSDTTLPVCTCSAVAELLVVVMVPWAVMFPPPPFSVMTLDPASRVAPEAWVMPMALTETLPAAVMLPRSMALESARVTALPLVMAMVPKSLPASDSVMLLALPAAMVVVPLTVRAPVWVMAPAAVTFSVVVVPVPRTKAPVSTKVVTLPLVMLTVLKELLAFDSVMLPLPPASVVVPAAVNTELAPCVMPAPVSDRVPSADRLPFTAKAPEAFRFNVPLPPPAGWLKLKLLMFWVIDPPEVDQKPM